jgi:hypothetical protein
VIETDRVFMGFVNGTVIRASAGIVASAAGTVDSMVGRVAFPAGVSSGKPLTAPQPVVKAMTKRLTPTALSRMGGGLRG